MTMGGRWGGHKGGASYYFTLQVYDYHSLSQKILLTLDEMNMNEERPDANYCKVHKYYFH